MSLFVGNISKNASYRDIEKAFKNYGHCKFNPRGKYAFVEFEREKDAEEARESLQGKTYGGSKITIHWSKKREQSSIDTMIHALEAILEAKVSIDQILIQDQEVIQESTAKRLRRIEKKKKPDQKALQHQKAHQKITKKPRKTRPTKPKESVQNTAKIRHLPVRVKVKVEPKVR